MRPLYVFLALVVFLRLGSDAVASTSTGPFDISTIVVDDASSCSAADGEVTLTIDASNQGVAPYDISLDNGVTWVVNNDTPNGSGEISASNVEWGTYSLAVRDAGGDVIYPGYASVEGCTKVLTATAGQSFSTAAVVGATGYTWTSSVGAISGGQNTVTATFDFSGVTHLATGSICVQPTGPTCTAPPTCFNITVLAEETVCNDGIDNDGDGLVDCADCTDCIACDDNDGDGITDLCDIDDDNDGIPDIDECADFSLGPELLLNGDFEDGYAHWTSDFNRGRNNQAGTSGGCATQGWVSISSCASENGQCPDYYDYTGGTPSGAAIITDALGTGANVIQTGPCSTDSWGCLASILPDHTTGSGLSMYVDPNDIVGEAYWKQQVTVTANTSYKFSAWLMVIEEDPNLQFKINGENLTAGFDLDRLTGGSDGPDVWQQFSADWFSASTSGTVTVELVNLRAGCGGNDLRLDDVSLRAQYGLCDADSDGIPNHLDLDSDNDGIFDVDEAGHAAADADNDGIIDGAPADFGSNGLFDGVETAADSDVIDYTISDSENALDGIYDAYELDSDGDGCFDTQEASVADSDVDGTAGTASPTVDADGLVSGITYATPASTTWKDYTYVALVCDTDNDLINPTVDIDDDNDGITDLIENNTVTNSYISPCTTDSEYDFGSNSLISGTDEEEGAVYRYSEVIPGVDALVTIEEINGISITDFDDDGSNSEWFKPRSNVFDLDDGEEAYVQYYFQFVHTGTVNSISVDAVNLLFVDLDGNSQYSETAWVEEPSAFTYDNPTDLTFVRDNAIHVTSGANEYSSVTDDYPQANFFARFVNMTAFRIRFGILSHQDGLNVWSARQHGLVFTCPDNYTDPVTVNADFDNDGILNALDLDSDNDGIFDVDEAGHAASDADDDGIIDGVPADFGSNGLFDGVETAADSDVIVYTISDSESTPDGIYDVYELDSDGDGCMDAQEESVSDPDGDGVAGTGVPAVDPSNGLVSSLTYASPPNSTWQNPGSDNCMSIAGTVFEDINYSGGSGRNYAAANVSAQTHYWPSDAIAIAGVRVELYASDNSFISSALTDAAGDYIFNNIPSGDYFVRFATQTAISMRASNSSGQAAYSVPTFRSVGSTEITNEIGGADPSKSDAGSNTTSADLTTLTTLSNVAQAVSSVSITTTSITNVDLGLSFSVITNTNDDGIGSVRQFIRNTNELANTNINMEDSPSGRPSLIKPTGTDVSIFEIPGVGTHVITPLSELPRIVDANTHLSGYTQQGSSQGSNAARVILIELDGNTLTFDGLQLFADNLQVSGLSIHSFRHGIYTNRANNTNAHVWGNYIGLEADGITSSTNGGSGIYYYNSVNAFIGMNADNNNDENEGNVIAHFEYGVQLRAGGGHLVAGNYIGTEKTGSAIRANDFVGVYLGSTTVANYVGFHDGLASLNPNHYRNVLSGNGNDGVRIVGCDNQVVAGNFIGITSSGLNILANTNYGVQITSTSSNNVIGTNSNGDDDTQERNVIAGNIGVRLGSSGSGSDNTIAGNYIGTDISGNTSLGSVNGIIINGAYTNTIIGTDGDNSFDEIEGNVISGHTDDGIRFFYTGSASVSGNKIGIGTDGTTALGNSKRGIFIEMASSDVTIGWSPSMANTDAALVGNTIKNNGDNGIAINGTGTRNRISRNQIANNAGLGIGLDNPLYNFDVTSNDNGDTDTGENNLMNFPVIEKAFLNGNDLVISGFSPAGSTIEFFVADGGINPNPLPAGYGASFGEGEAYLFSEVEGSVNDLAATVGDYTDDGTGIVSTRSENRFRFEFDVTGLGLSPLNFITSTATDATNNTSEFSGASVILIPEICNDLLDNDGDGDVDCDDDDCPGVGVVNRVSH